MVCSDMAAHAADLPHSLTSAVFMRFAFEAFDPRIGAVGVGQSAAGHRRAERGCGVNC